MPAFAKKGAVLSLLGSLLVVCGCGRGRGPGAVNFNNDLTNIMKDMTTIGQDFTTALKTRDGARIKTALGAAVARFDQVKARSASVKVPEGKEAQDFYAIFQEYMSVQEKIVKQDFKEIT